MDSESTHKVYHTNITIQSVEDVPNDPTSIDTSQTTHQHSQTTTIEEVAEQTQAALLQEWFDEGISKTGNLPGGYKNVAVLIIKWDDELDELNTGPEAKELENVFRNRFHFDTKTVELNVASKPQHQLSHFVSAFIHKHDGDSNLLIVYYTGHGVYHRDHKQLEMRAFDNPDDTKGPHLKQEARATWNLAETSLRSEAVESDVLVILDTCYASNHHTKSMTHESKTFELFSACAIDATTAAPGDMSFTRALIVALENLQTEYGDKPFTTQLLNQKILLDPNRSDSPSQLWTYDRHIRLAPLKPLKIRKLEALTLHHPPGSYLTLRFALRDISLNREQMTFLTKKLSEAFSNKSVFGLRRIDWLGLKPARTTSFGRAALAIFVIAQWKKFVLKKQEARARAPRPVDLVTLPMERSAESPPFLLVRKRTRETLDDLPDSKRGSFVRSLTGEEPPSPPVSNPSPMSNAGDEGMKEGP
ncbi:hypothetical protein K504DRAFT_370526 [Pleomassaria siparia CBS 279.74]|uniref:Peptidase C14 caspase domain-containing protein n=1 Tax=Pleomassaria siparia CBS 279.74 TaxID=1314801 RepID=A0A6G1KNP5_9PLEO|nr:hypothetical protein K504DRAFT_370526 [Pleomassaria siparia CBS 279.74]